MQCGDKAPQVVMFTPQQLCWLTIVMVTQQISFSGSLLELLSANHRTLNLFPTSWLMVFIASASLWFHCLGIYVLPSVWGTQICFPYQLPVSFSLLPVQILVRENLTVLASNHRLPHWLSDQQLSNLDIESPERFTKTQMAPHRL